MVLRGDWGQGKPDRRKYTKSGKQSIETYDPAEDSAHRVKL